MNIQRLILLGFLAGGLVNILGVLIFSAGFTSDGLARLQPALFSDFGLVAIMLWGLAYIAVSRSYVAVPWLVAVFAVEKLAYGIAWLSWMSAHGGELGALFGQQPLSATFMLIYGPNDWVFCLFFAWVFLVIRRGHVQPG